MPTTNTLTATETGAKLVDFETANTALIFTNERITLGETGSVSLGMTQAESGASLSEILASEIDVSALETGVKFIDFETANTAFIFVNDLLTLIETGSATQSMGQNDSVHLIDFEIANTAFIYLFELLSLTENRSSTQGITQVESAALGESLSSVVPEILQLLDQLALADGLVSSTSLVVSDHLSPLDQVALVAQIIRIALSLGISNVRSWLALMLTRSWLSATTERTYIKEYGDMTPLYFRTGETHAYGLDFTKALSAGDSLVSATATLLTSNGADVTTTYVQGAGSSPATATVSGTQASVILADTSPSTLSVNTTYTLSFIATTANGSKVHGDALALICDE